MPGGVCSWTIGALKSACPCWTANVHTTVPHRWAPFWRHHGPKGLVVRNPLPWPPPSPPMPRCWEVSQQQPQRPPAPFAARRAVFTCKFTGRAIQLSPCDARGALLLRWAGHLRDIFFLWSQQDYESSNGKDLFSFPLISSPNLSTVQPMSSKQPPHPRQAAWAGARDTDRHSSCCWVSVGTALFWRVFPALPVPATARWKGISQCAQERLGGFREANKKCQKCQASL